MGPIPATWLPDARIERIHIHWTAGGHVATDFDKKHYHVLWNFDGYPVKGVPSIAANGKGANRQKTGAPASHTLNANTGAIGVSLCCMGGANERDPVNSTRYPMTRAQWDAMVEGVAQMCIRYGITPGPKTVLMHAEVEKNLGIKQRGKWDIAFRSFDPTRKGAATIGNILRAEVKAAVARLKAGIVTNEDGEDAPEPEMPPAPAPVTVTATVPGDEIIQPAPIVVRQWTEDDIKRYQQKLFDLGYDPKGIDGKPGTMTKAAVTRMKEVNGIFPTTGELDVATVEFLMGPNVKPMQVSAERAAATSAQIAAKAPVAAEARKSWFWQAVGWIGGLVTYAISNVRGSIGDAIETVKPVTDALGDIPQGVVIGGVALVAGYGLLKAYQASTRADDAYRQGKL